MLCGLFGCCRGQRGRQKAKQSSSDDHSAGPGNVGVALMFFVAVGGLLYARHPLCYPQYTLATSFSLSPRSPEVLVVCFIGACP